MLILVRLGQE